jgi:hypothetical protein
MPQMFERCLVTQKVVTFEILSDDYSKVITCTNAATFEILSTDYSKVITGRKCRKC